MTEFQPHDEQHPPHNSSEEQSKGLAQNPLETFDELVISRKRWIEEILKPWCLSAARKELRLAEMEWGNLAGKVDVQKTLWAWAWSRFPLLVHEGLNGLNETHLVNVTLHSGETFQGYPDARESEHGLLVLLSSNSKDMWGPFSLDDIQDVTEVCSAG